MFLSVVSRCRPSISLPHAGGGVSAVGLGTLSQQESSPRRWGCFSISLAQGRESLVFPTQVGVFLVDEKLNIFTVSLPHAGGGVSSKGSYRDALEQSSPRRWGCFLGQGLPQSLSFVFPTQVGVFLALITSSSVGSCLPHAGGGVSVSASRLVIEAMSSPRRWGCFRMSRSPPPAHPVFPTQVGVFPIFLFCFVIKTSLPHAGGGVSLSATINSVFIRSSPRRWGCFQVCV